MHNAVAVGREHDARRLIALLNRRSSHWRLRYYSPTCFGTLTGVLASCVADAIVCFGGPGPNMALVEVAQRRRIPVVVVWNGNDVLAAKRDPYLLELIKRYRLTHVSDAPWLAQELRALGIDAPYVPMTAVERCDAPAPLPDEFRVLTYLPEPIWASGEKAVYSIARDLPNVRFCVAGAGEGNPVAPSNVEFLGNVRNLDAAMDRSVALLRLAQNDGTPAIVLEMLARGRRVVWNRELPGVDHAQRAIDARRALEKLREEHTEGTRALNDEGRAFVSAHFAPDRVMPEVERLLERARDASAVPKEQRCRVAISGLNLFAAQVSAELDRQDYGWAPEFLRMGDRLEVLTSMVKLTSCDVWYSIGSPIGDRWLHLFARVLRKPRVIHWVGSDIAALSRDRRLRSFSSQPSVQNLAEVEWTIDELHNLGIDATLAPLPPRIPARKIMPLPERFTVLLYLPPSRGEFYGRREYERLIRAFAKRNVAFIVVGGGDLYAPPEADVRRLGWCVKLEDVYRDTTVLIRFTQHDGLSLMALEALTYGRYVLWSQDFPYATQVRSYDEIERAIGDLLECFERGELTIQSDAAHYVAQTYDASRCVSRLAKAWTIARTARSGRRFAMKPPMNEIAP